MRTDPDLHAPGPRRRRRGRVALVGVAALALGLCGAAAYPVVSGRTDPPRFRFESAERALAEARDARADRWAPDALRSAESAMRNAWVERRRQEARFVLFRDFALARAAYASAEERARQATEQAAKGRSADRESSEAAIARAEDDVGAADDVGSTMHLGTYGRVVLRKAKLALDEARFFHASEEYARARDQAARATSLAVRVGADAATAAARFVDATWVRRWKGMADDTIRQSRTTGGTAVVIYKDSHRLVLYSGGRPVKSYRAELGYNATRDKVHAGDAATPEGRYRIIAKKGLGNSTYHRALLLDYPNDDDRAEFDRLRRAGKLPRWAKVGGMIEIHGDGGKGRDWTRGCVALSNPDIDDLFGRVGVGTPVTIVGSDGHGGAFTEIVRRHQANGTARPQ